MAKPVKVTLKDGSTRYRAKVDIGRDPISGRRVQTTITRPTKQACLDAVSEARSRAKSGEARASVLTVQAYLAGDWLPHKRASGIRANTLRGYVAAVRDYLVPVFGNVKLGKLETVAIQRWVNAMPGEPRTVRGRLQVLSMALNQAVRWRLLARNPCQGVIAPSVRPASRTVLTGEELERFLASTAGEPYHAAWCLMGRAGLRAGEVCALLWSDLDLERGLVRIRRTITKDEDGHEVVGSAPKRGSGRDVLIDPATVQALRAMPRRGLWCFPDPNDAGRPVNTRRPRRELARTSVAKGFPRLTPHDFRYMHGTWMMTEGIHPSIAMDRLGHTTMAMMAHYTKAVVEHQAAVVTRLAGRERVVDPGEPGRASSP